MHSPEFFRLRRGRTTLDLWLDGKNILARANWAPGESVRIRLTYTRQLGQSGDWDFGLYSRFGNGADGMLGAYAEGSVFGLACSVLPAARAKSPLELTWPDRTRPAEAWLDFAFGSTSRDLTLAIGQADAPDAALGEATSALQRAGTSRRRQWRRAAQEASRTPRLEGDWPDHWRRGLKYDLDTVRATMRDPRGILRDTWDGMQIQVPRQVLAEAALDALILSYADPDLARRSIAGVFRNSPAPNIPCIREDGSVNMVTSDGQPCGTAPSWCWPAWCIALLAGSTENPLWHRSVRAGLERYLRWWLANRAAPGGWVYYLCGWESGQDASPRFNAESGGGGIEEIEPVDLTAAMAADCALLTRWRSARGLPADDWPRNAERFERRLQTLWRDGWFHDRRANAAIAVRDPMHLAPAMHGYVNAAQRELLRRSLTRLPAHGSFSPLEWPPVALTAFEAASALGEWDWLAESVAELCDRVWRAIDAPTHETGRPLPGIAHEHWPIEGEWHTEGYGWGAATALFFLRYICGIRDEPLAQCSEVAPRFPACLRRPGAVYYLRGLPRHDGRVDVTYVVAPDGTVTARVAATSGE
ncbi:MAG: hypothetical protein FJ033_03495 [Chloroflexi bacterium]|nr:hypothetical protein [Chloroflexota bacterium]